MPVQQRKNGARRLEEFIAVAPILLPARRQTRQAGFSEDQFFAGKPVGAHCRMQGRHQERRRDSLAADIAYSNADSGLVAPGDSVVLRLVKNEKVVEIAA